MRVKLQLVMCSDDGQEETITDIVTLRKGIVKLMKIADRPLPREQT